MDSLKSLLDNDADIYLTPDTQLDTSNLCIECQDHPFEWYCEICQDNFCLVCLLSVHRSGNRKSHSVINLQTNDKQLAHLVKVPKPQLDITQSVEMMDVQCDKSASDLLERSKFIPLRLVLKERKLLRLLEAALNVSEYTDKIDVLCYGNKTKRIYSQIKEICSILSGLVVAADYKTGQELITDKQFKDNEVFFQTIFEIGRRNKIMNPEKMRSTYGKLIYLLQDSQLSQVKDLLEFNMVKPIVTVHDYLQQNESLDLLKDELCYQATKEITTKINVQMEIKKKERAIEILAKKYAKPQLGFTDEQVKQCLYSIGDNNSFLRTNRDPCDTMIDYLKQYFDPSKIEPGFSLAIQAGKNGARLSHNHSKQYDYCLQSLSLWREIQHDMFQLWMNAEQDLLSNSYRLCDTGQGLNRIQSCPRVSRMMQNILSRAQQKVGYWVGSSVIHLGDHNVPNSLMFIDKYTQIYRILLPITTMLSRLDSLNYPGLDSYIEKTFKTVDNAKKVVLVDFFRYAFDGSGADNFFDAGSCIDGRLTSAWNWCSLLEKKVFYPLFLLTGFVGFDGDF